MAGTIYHKATGGITGGLGALVCFATGGVGAGAVSLSLAVLHILWITGYPRAAVKLCEAGATANKLGAESEEEVEKRIQQTAKLCRAVKRSLNAGVGIGVLGMVVAAIGTEQVLGAVLYRMFEQKGWVLEFWLANPPLRMSVSDVFATQANVGALLTHLVGFVSSRRLHRIFHP